MRKQKIAGIALIFLGILCATLLILYSLHHAEYMWYMEAKSKSFDSFSQYYFQSSKGALLLSGVSGIALTASGIRLLRHRPE